MSFSINAKGKTKSEVMDAIRIGMGEIVQQQPVHAKDYDTVMTTVAGYVDNIREAKDYESITVNVSGSLVWDPRDQIQDEVSQPQVFTGASISVNAYILREASENVG
jgi:predicted HAD superfamily hydrolase